MTVEFLAIEDEWDTLRSVNRCLSKLYHCKTFLFSRLGSFFETVAKTMVIVTADIAYVLERVVGPAFHAHLRVLDSTGDSEMDVLLVSGHTVHKTGIFTAERATDSITDIVAECAHLVEHIGIGLKGNFLSRICRSLRCPTFSIDHHIRVNRVKTLADDVHCLDIVDSHQVKAESVDMIFLHPPLERLDHIFAEHFLLRSCLISAARTVEEASIFTHTVEISRHCAFETGLGCIRSVIVNHIENHAEAGLMKSLDHLLEFLDTGNRIVWVCRIRTLDSIVVVWIISPVILIVLKTCLIHSDEVCRREKLDISHSDLLEMVDTGSETVRILCTFLCKSKILTLIVHSRSLMDGEIPVMHLINDDVRRLDERTLVLSPSFRICLIPIDHCTASTVYSDSLSCYTFGLLKPLSVLLHLECIESALHVFFHCRLPKSVLSELHILGLEGSLLGSRMIKPQTSRISIRSPYCKFCLVAHIDALLERSLRYDECTIFRCTGSHSGHCNCTHQ